MKRGFTIIEVVLAVMLASLVSMSLYQLLRTASGSVSDMRATMDVDTPVSGFFNQVEKDVTGMFAPFSSIQKLAKKDFDAKKEKELPFKKGNKDQQKNDEPKEIQVDGAPIEDVFVLEAQGDRFFLSFITTGGLQMLDRDGTVPPTPFARRVAYFLEPDANRPGMQRMIYRFSGTDLSLGAIQSASFSPSYEIISDIKSLSIEITLMDLSEGEDEKQGPRPVTLKQWNADEVWDTYKTLIPAYLSLSGVRTDALGAETPFEIACKVYAYSPYVEKEKTLFEKLEDIASKLWKK